MMIVNLPTAVEQFMEISAVRNDPRVAETLLDPMDEMRKTELFVHEMGYNNY